PVFYPQITKHMLPQARTLFLPMNNVSICETIIAHCEVEGKPKSRNVSVMNCETTRVENISGNQVANLTQNRETISRWFVCCLAEVGLFS
ncbi:MAG: hypothetical protein PHU80_00210, partial [Kiritimatiellae bacterium]|nr:hypothetical protein [Kiritimatiellia bacterium]